MHSKLSTCYAAVMMLAAWSCNAEAAGKFKTIAPPRGNNTAAQAINAAGDIAGCYYDGKNALRSFLWIAGSGYTTFGVKGSTYFNVAGVNADDTVAGSFSDTNGTHGFVRTSDGTFVQVDVPGDNESTDISGINAGGAAAGIFFPVDGAAQGFVRSADGTFVTFQGDPKAVSTNAESINDKGAVAGGYADADGAVHFYLRSPKGKFTTYDVADSVTNGFVTGLNDQGDTIGRYIDSANVTHGFIRTTDGTVTAFDAPGAPLSTYPFGINAKGYVVGSYQTSDYVVHGFLRAPNGTITSFDHPDTQDTHAAAINDKGEIVGYYEDDSGLHGFFRKK